MVDINWTGIDLSGDPRLIVGRRPRPKHLEAERVDVHQDAHPALREIAETAVQELADTQQRVYEPFAELEIGEEHFELQVGVGAAGADGAELPRLISVVDELTSVDARDLKEQQNLFYALCWTSSAGVTGFVRQTDPVRVLRHGRRFFQYQDALRSVEAPDFALDGFVDFVFHAGTVGILRPTPFRNLFADVDVALSGVPTYIANARAALASTAPITDSSAAALQSVVSRRVTFASRLRRLADRLAEVPITADAMLAAAARHIDDPSLVIDSSGQLEFDEDHVGVVLDLLEGRLFEDDFSGQHRRADRFSSR